MIDIHGRTRRSLSNTRKREDYGLSHLWVLYCYTNMLRDYCRVRFCLENTNFHFDDRRVVPDSEILGLQ